MVSSIRSLRLKIFLLFGVLACFHPVKAQYVIGSRALALGNAASALTGNGWAVFGNPAMIAETGSMVSFYGSRNYGLNELSDKAAVLAISFPHVSLATGILGYGNEHFKKYVLQFALAGNWKEVYVGISAGYHHISFSGIYGSAGSFGLNAGVAVDMGNNLWLASKASNINLPAYGNSEEELPRDLAIGLSSTFENKSLFTFELYKDVRFPLSVRAGLEVKIVKGVFGRLGVTGYPQTYSLGLGIKRGFIQVNLAVQNHHLLGYSQAGDFSYAFPHD